MKIQLENENKRPFENLKEKSIKITKIQLDIVNENSIRKLKLKWK